MSRHQPNQRFLDELAIQDSQTPPNSPSLLRKLEGDGKNSKKRKLEERDLDYERPVQALDGPNFSARQSEAIRRLLELKQKIFAHGTHISQIFDL